jgi:hypothetical protein
MEKSGLVSHYTNVLRLKYLRIESTCGRGHNRVTVRATGFYRGSALLNLVKARDQLWLLAGF